MAETILATRRGSKAIVHSIPHFSAERIWTIQGWGLVLLTFMSFFPSLFNREEYLFFLLLAVAVIIAWKTGQSVWVRSPIDLPLALFLGWVLVTIPFAVDPGYSFGEWRKLVAQILVFYWALLVLRHHKDGALIRRLLTAVALATAVLCVYAISDFVARGGTWRDRLIRANAPLSDYNWLSTYLVMALPLLLAVVAGNRGRFVRFASMALVLVALVTQLLSYTRAGWMGIAAQAVSYGFFTARRRLVIWMLAGGLLFGLGLFALSQMGYHRDTVDPWTLQTRLAVWKLELGDVMEHPLLGVGYGSQTFMKRFAAYPETKRADGPHSTFLMVAMGSGIPALVFLMWIFVGAIRALVRRAIHISNRHAYTITLAVALVVVGLMVRNIFDYMFAGSLAYLFWILLAMGLTEAMAKTRSARSSIRANESLRTRESAPASAVE